MSKSSWIEDVVDLVHHFSWRRIASRWRFRLGGGLRLCGGVGVFAVVAGVIGGAGVLIFIGGLVRSPLVWVAFRFHRTYERCLARSEVFEYLCFRARARLSIS